MRAFVGFGGFGLVDIVLREAGFETISVEIDPAVAEVNRINGGNVITADILTLDPADFIGYWLAHFSPPCPSFSQASQSEESELDIALARWVARFVVVVQPQYVWAYRNSQSWSIVLEALTGMGYAVDWWHLNAADYGVPQTRKRMIAIARLDRQQPTKPKPTHRDARKDDPGQFSLFDNRLPPWVGWYEAIADLIPTLPDSQFAPWQEDRMPAELRTFILGQGERSTAKDGRQPADTVTANTNQTGIKAFIVDSQNGGSGDKVTIRQAAAPMMTVPANLIEKGAAYRAYTQGRIVSMTPRALARFQSIPDWFKLPGELSLSDHLNLAQMLLDDDRSPRSLACYGLGNAVPPLLYRAALKSLGAIR